MSKFRQVTLTADGKEYVSLVNLDRVVMIVPYEGGCKLEIAEGFVYTCKEKIADFR